MPQSRKCTWPLHDYTLNLLCFSPDGEASWRGALHQGTSPALQPRPQNLEPNRSGKKCHSRDVQEGKKVSCTYARNAAFI